MRLVADEDVHADVIRGLRQADYDSLSVQDIWLSGHKDGEILEYSEKQDLILSSGDKDFGGLNSGHFEDVEGWFYFGII